MNLKLVEIRELKMSSREIAELCGKQHKHVRRDVLMILKELKEDESKFGRIYLDPMNREQEEYLLPKDLTFTLISGYSIKLRKKIIDRWLELEDQPKSPEQMFLEQAQINYEHSQRLRLVESKLEKLDPDTGYRTITAHCKIENISLSLKKANYLGRRLSKLCKDRDIEIGQVPDERFGQVNSYPINLIEETLADNA